MRQIFHVVTVAVILLGVGRASAQSVTYAFEDGTDQGWGDKFADDASKTFPIVNIGGSNRMHVLRDGGFQEAERSVGNPADPLYQALLAASANEAGYEISYDYYINTAEFTGGAGTYLQGGTYVNTGSGYFKQNFPDTGKEIELNSVQLASGQVFSGTVTQTLAAKTFEIPAGETFFRLGLILNGDGPNQAVYYDNISVRPVPEPAALALLGAALPVLTMRRRRRASARAVARA